MSTDTVPEALAELERDWRPGPDHGVDVVRALAPSTFAALLDVESPVTADGDPLPALWHWLLFPTAHPHSALGEDGHPRDAALTPPLPRRRRMFGGGRLWVDAPLRCGDEVERHSEVTSIRTRMGRSGPLLLVTVRHELSVAGRRRLVEEQDLVYRQAAEAPTRASGRASAAASGGPRAGTPPSGERPPEAPWRLTLRPDPVLLFRFSALTSNTHRIHYDRPYATEVEGHRSLVVHGPLLAMLLLELPRRHGASPIVELSWRARQPLFDDETIEVHGWPEDARLELAAGADGAWERVQATARTAVPGSA